MMAEQTMITLGEARLPASRVGIGTWAIGGGWGPQPESDSLDALRTALECGCALIDTAPLYGNGHAERLIARAQSDVGWRVTTLTKVYPLQYHWAPSPGTPIEDIYPPEHIIAQVEGSLRRLSTDCLDCLLLQTWCPSWDAETSWYETMLTLQKQGKIRAFGISVSDHRADEANGVIEAGRVDIVEAPYSVLDQRAAERLFPLAERYGVSIIARCPLASGALAGTWYPGRKFHRDDWRRRVFRGGVFEQMVRRVDELKAIVDSTVPLAQTALRFCLSHPAVTAVIPGVRSAEQARCNLAVLGQDALPEALLSQIERCWHEEWHRQVRTSIGEEGEGEQRAGGREQATGSRSRTGNGSASTREQDGRYSCAKPADCPRT